MPILVQILFHGRFDDEGTLHHVIHDYDENLYQALPYTYAVLISKQIADVKKIVGGVVIRTNDGHANPNFSETLIDACCGIPDLDSLVDQGSSLLPAKIGPPPEGTRITKNQLIDVLMTQYIKFSPAGGNA